MRRKTLPLTLGCATCVVFAACSGLRDQEIIIDDGDAKAGSSANAGTNGAGTNGGGSPNGDAQGGDGSDIVGAGGAGKGDDDIGIGGLPMGGAPSLDGPPTVVSVKPAHETAGVAPGSAVRIDFSEELDEATVTAANIQVKDGATAIAGQLTYQAATVVFTPAVPLSLLTRYQVSVGTAVKDATGVALATAFSSTFDVRDGVWDAKEVSFASDYTKPFVASPAGGIDARGNVLVAWSETNDIKARWYDAAKGAWGGITTVETRSAPCSAPRVAVSENGNAVIAFEMGGTTPQTWARRFVNGAWEAVEQLVQNPTAGSAYLAKPQPAFHGDRIMLVWSRRAGTANMAVEYIDSATAGPTGAWKVIAEVESAPIGVKKEIGSVLGFDMDAAGNAIIGYGYNSGSGTFAPTFMRYTATNGAWSPGAPLRQSSLPALGADQLGFGPVVGVNPSGDAIMAWVTKNGAAFDLVASRFTKAGGWEAPAPLEKADGNAFVTSRGVTAHGQDFTVVWKQDIGGGTFNGYRNTYSGAEKSFGESALLSSGDTNIWFGEPNVFGDARGNALAAWSEGGDLGENPKVTFSRYDALTGKWSDPGKLTSLTGDGYSEALLVGGPNGAAAALLTTYADGGWTGARVNLFH